MPFIVIREYDPGNDILQCLAQFGFSEEIGRSKFDLYPLSNYPSFLKAVEERIPVIEPCIDAGHLINLRNEKEIFGVKSFVITPVLVGDSCFGTLSFGAPCYYEYSPIEVAGLASISNSIGTAIANYRNFHHSTIDILEKTRTSTIISAIELTQVARHEAMNHIDTAQIHLATIAELLKKTRAGTVQELTNKTMELSAELNETFFALEKIKAITKPPTRKKELG